MARVRRQLTQHTHDYIEVPDLPDDAIVVNLGAGGLGDALLAMCAVKGLSRLHPGRAIRYRVAAHAIPFVELFDGGFFDLTAHDCDGCADLPATPVPTDVQMNIGYGNECKTRMAIPRVQRWARNLAGVTPERVPLRDAEDVRAACPVEHIGTVVLAPFSTWPSREYPIHAWRTLERRLLELGYRVLTLDARDARYPDRHLQMRGEKLIDAPAKVVTGIILNAKCFIGCDSGLAHLSGSVGTPTLILCGQTLHKDIYAFYGPHTRGLEGHLDCRGCYWQPPYHSAKCDPVCPNLASNTPEEIAAAVLEMAGPPATGRASTFHLNPGETGKAHARRQREGWYLEHVETPAIDVGCGRDPLLAPFPVQRWDQILGDGDCTVMAGELRNHYATVYASHVLEHVPDPIRALRCWYDLLRLGGKLIACVPHRDLYEGKPDLPSRWNGDHKTFWLPDTVGPDDPWHTLGLRQVVEQALPGAEIVSSRVLEDGHKPPDPANGIHACGEYSIEIIIRKPDHPFVQDRSLNREIEGHLSKLLVPGFKSHLGSSPVLDRRHTMRLFLRYLVGKEAPLVVETGCQREELDYGAGMSTTLFGLLLKGRGGKLISLDNSPTNVDFCKSLMAGLPVEVALADSREWLKQYAGPNFDGLYLDSQDTDTPGYQDCCLEEAQAAYRSLAPDALVMIDDTWRTNGEWKGKGTKAVPWLLSHGWQILGDGWQVVLKKAI